MHVMKMTRSSPSPRQLHDASNRKMAMASVLLLLAMFAWMATTSSSSTSSSSSMRVGLRRNRVLVDMNMTGVEETKYNDTTTAAQGDDFVETLVTTDDDVFVLDLPDSPTTISTPSSSSSTESSPTGEPSLQDGGTTTATTTSESFQGNHSETKDDNDNPKGLGATVAVIVMILLLFVVFAIGAFWKCQEAKVLPALSYGQARIKNSDGDEPLCLEVASSPSANDAPISTTKDKDAAVEDTTTIQHKNATTVQSPPPSVSSPEPMPILNMQAALAAAMAAQQEGTTNSP